MIIKDVHSYQILDCKGDPALFTTIMLSDGIIGNASVPSSGFPEELSRLKNNGVKYSQNSLKDTIAKIHHDIKKSIVGRNILDQIKLDNILLSLDGTEDKHNLAANSILCVSLACLDASSKHLKIPLYKRVNQIYYQMFGDEEKLNFPTPMISMINKSIDLKSNVSFQEFMIVPVGIERFSEKIRASSEIYHKLGNILEESGFRAQIGANNAFAPPIHNTLKIMQILEKAVEKAGYKMKEEIMFAIDAQGDSLYKNNTYEINSVENESISDIDYSALCEMYIKLCNQFPILSIEDPMSSEDIEGWSYMKTAFEKIHPAILLIGDNLTLTEEALLRKNKEYINGALVVPSDIGSFIETLKFANNLKRENKKVILSDRISETCDSSIFDIALGINADYIKNGAPSGGERVAKYNRGMIIEEDLVPYK